MVNQPHPAQTPAPGRYIRGSVSRCAVPINRGRSYREALILLESCHRSTGTDTKCCAQQWPSENTLA